MSKLEHSTVYCNFMMLLKISFFILFGIVSGVRQKFTVQPFYNVKGTMIGLIGLGTPTQPTSMELNPTTPEFFVVPSNCKTTGCTKNRQGFNTVKSTTYYDNGRKVPFQTGYLGTKSIGIIANESLTALAIPGKTPPTIPLPVVDEPHGDLVEGYATGLMGLGFLPADSKLPASFLQGLLQALDLPVFEVFLQSYKHTKDKDISTTGNVTYGNRDTDHCDDKQLFLKTIGNREWTVKMDYARIGMSKLVGGKVLFYPGSPRIHAPLAAVQAIRQRIHAKYDSKLNEYYVDCAEKKKLPRLYLAINHRLIGYYPREYLVQSEGTNKCLLMISGPSKRYTGADWILGDPILKEHCIYFDFNGPQIGFSDHKNSQSASRPKNGRKH